MTWLTGHEARFTLSLKEPLKGSLQVNGPELRHMNVHKFLAF